MRNIKWRNLLSCVALGTIAAVALTLTSCDDEAEVKLPTITSVSPTEAEVGESVTITGTNLGDAFEVKFNGVTALIDSKSATSIATKVPAGATSGKITVTTAAGTATSASDFSVLEPAPIPAVTRFAPVSGQPGDEIKIIGTNLEEVSAVTIDGVAATIGTKNATSIVITVPANATTGKIAVTSPGGTDESDADFTFVSAEAIAISGFEEENASEAWGIAQDGDGGITVSEIKIEDDNAYFQLTGSDVNTNHWVGGRYHEVNPETPVGITETDLESVWMSVDVKANAAGTSIGKLVYTVIEAGAPDNRRNYEIDFNIDWTEWKTISIRLDGFGYWDPGISAMRRAHETNPDITTIWSVALFLKGGSTDTYDISWDNLRFSEGAPIGEEVTGF